MGYRDDSPYRDEPFIDINTPSGKIDMSETGIPLMANGRYLPPYSGMHQFEPGIVREQPMHQMPDGSMMSGESHGEYEDLELTDEEIAEYRKGGYVVEMQDGGANEYDMEIDGIPVKRVYKGNSKDRQNYDLVDKDGNVITSGMGKPNESKLGFEDSMPLPKSLRPSFEPTRQDSAEVYNAGKAAMDFRNKSIDMVTMYPGSKVEGEYNKMFDAYSKAGNSNFGYSPDFKMLESYEDYKPSELPKKRPYVKPMEHVAPRGLTASLPEPTPSAVSGTGATLPLQPTIIGYTQKWNPELKKWEQEPQYQVIGDKDANRRQDGGALDLGAGPLKEQNPFLIPEYNQPMNGNIILPDVNRPQLEGTNATEYKIGVGFDDGNVTIPTVVGGQYIGNEGAIDRYKATGERFKEMPNPNSYSNFYDTVEPLGLMKKQQGGAYEEMELSDQEIAQMRAQGYRIDEL